MQARVGRAELIEGHEGVGEGADETSGDGARRTGNERGRREGVDETRAGRPVGQAVFSPRRL